MRMCAYVIFIGACVVASGCGAVDHNTTPTCTDTTRNGQETDIDCGASCPSRCTQGQRCIGPDDCDSAVCLAGTCAAPDCSDRVRNGSETGVDCGGLCGPCDPGIACRNDGDCRFGCGLDKLCRQAASCSAILAAVPSSTDGVYTIAPDSGEPTTALSVYCDMTTQGGGWMLVGKIGDQLSHFFSTLFDTDLNVAQLMDRDEPTSTQYAHWDLNHFNGYGSAWTVRVSVDSGTVLPGGTGTVHQYSYYRPRSGMACPPGIAGANWLGTSTASLLEHKTGNHTTWPSNTTWLPLGHYDSAGATLWLFGYRDGSAGMVDCIDASNQTKLCHSPAGVVQNQIDLLGTYTAAYGVGDGIPHQHSKRASS